jgi:4-aminobutyrate aminotransferase/(S)-3-amino-2-methylpropionate transaminase
MECGTHFQVDIPAFDWPCAPFPERKYPLNENEDFNAKEEAKCLQEYEQILIDSYVPSRPHWSDLT